MTSLNKVCVFAHQQRGGLIFVETLARAGPVCIDFSSMILKINLTAVFQSENLSIILSKNSAYQPRYFEGIFFHGSLLELRI